MLSLHCKANGNAISLRCKVRDLAPRLSTLKTRSTIRTARNGLAPASTASESLSSPGMSQDKKPLAQNGTSGQKPPRKTYFRTPVIVCSTMLFMTSAVSMPVTYPNTLPSLSIMNVVGNDLIPYALNNWPFVSISTGYVMPYS